MSNRPKSRETRQRRCVYEAIRRSPTHPTAERVFREVRLTLPNISLGTVYRNLLVLRDEGRVREVHGTDRRTRYETTESPHAHFICSTCGQIRDIQGPPEIDWRSLKEMVGCEVVSQLTGFLGTCAACLRRTTPRN